MTHTYRSPFFFLSGDVASSRRSCVTWPHTLCSIGSRSGLIVPVSELNRADMAPGIWLLVDRSCSRPDGGFGPDSAPVALEAPPPLDRQPKAPPPMSRGMNPFSMSDLFWTRHTQRVIVQLWWNCVLAIFFFFFFFQRNYSSKNSLIVSKKGGDKICIMLIKCKTKNTKYIKEYMTEHIWNIQ